MDVIIHDYRYADKVPMPELPEGEDNDDRFAHLPAPASLRKPVQPLAVQEVSNRPSAISGAE